MPRSRAQSTSTNTNPCGPIPVSRLVLLHLKILWGGRFGCGLRPLKLVSQRKLHHPRPAASAGLDAADNARGRVVERSIRQQKIRVVEEIEHFIPELNSAPLTSDQFLIRLILVYTVPGPFKIFRPELPGTKGRKPN